MQIQGDEATEHTRDGVQLHLVDDGEGWEVIQLRRTHGVGVAPVNALRGVVEVPLAQAEGPLCVHVGGYHRYGLVYHLHGEDALYLLWEVHEWDLPNELDL